MSHYIVSRYGSVCLYCVQGVCYKAGKLDVIYTHSALISTYKQAWLL